MRATVEHRKAAVFGGWLAGSATDGADAAFMAVDPAGTRPVAAAGAVFVVPGLPFPLVHVDNGAIAHMAAGHLLERGFRQFGFFGIEGEFFADLACQLLGSCECELWVEVQLVVVGPADQRALWMVVYERVGSPSP